MSEVLEPDLTDERWYELNDPGYAQEDGQLETPEEAFPERGLVGQLGLASDPVQLVQGLGEEYYVDEEYETAGNCAPDQYRHQLAQTAHNLAVHGPNGQLSFGQVVDTDRQTDEKGRC